MNIRPDSAGDILAGRRFLYPENLELVGGVRGKRLLDMGGGDGAEMLEWARAGAIVTGVDNSPVQLASARRNAERLGVECRLVQADLLRLPEDLLQGEFDIVFSAWVETWIGDLDGWFANARRALKPGGRFLLNGGHPVSQYVQDVEEGKAIQGSYFEEGPFVLDEDPSEADSWNPVGDSVTKIEWTHTLGSLVTAVAGPDSASTPCWSCLTPMRPAQTTALNTASRDARGASFWPPPRRERNERGDGRSWKLRLILDSIRFEHTIFALPFAYLGMVLAEQRSSHPRQFLWITVAMASARTLAMSANRIIDRRLDAQNPRTAARPLPAGRIRLWEMTAMSTVSLAVFLVSAAMLNPLALALAPVAAVVVVGYSYTKRFTWTSHFILGWADGIAPAGAWIAVTGTLSWEPVLLAFAVATWIGGFDILYSCQDYDFDIERGLHSIPQKFGIPAALVWAKVMHVLTTASLVAMGPWIGLGFPYYIGCALAAALLVYEHRLVSPTDLSRLNMAFFNVNGYIAVIMFVFTFASIYV